MLVLAADRERDLAVIGLVGLGDHVVGGAERHGPIGEVQQGDVLGVQVEVAHGDGYHDEPEQAL